MNDIEKYKDIINLPHHVSKKHPQMSLEERSAQFAPFAALTGYDDAVKETARLTNARIELDEEEKEILNRKLKTIKNKIYTQPKAKITYFVPDDKKDGGKYVTIISCVCKIDDYKQMIILEDKVEIPINDIIDIQIKDEKNDNLKENN